MLNTLLFMVAMIFMAAFFVVNSATIVEEDPYHMLSNDELKRLCNLYDIDTASDITREELIFLVNEYVKY